MSALDERWADVDPETLADAALEAPRCECARPLLDGDECAHCGREIREPGTLSREFRRASYSRQLTVRARRRVRTTATSTRLGWVDRPNGCDAHPRHKILRDMSGLRPRMGQPSRRASMEVIEAGGLLLERLAKRHELDGLMEIVNRQEGHVGEAPEQRAFALLGFGLPIYREKGHSEYFPAKSRRSRRRGARAVRDSLATEGGEQAVIFATHAIPAFAIAFWQCQAQQGQVEDVGAYEDYHGTIRSLLQGHYPLRQEDKDALLYARREVDVFKTGRPVTDLGVPLTGYGLALKEGRDPHENASLVESHSAYALHVFRVEAQNHALRVGLASEPYESLMNDLLSPWDFSRDAGIWRLTIDAHWTEVVGDYFEWVSPRAA